MTPDEQFTEFMSIYTNDIVKLCESHWRGLEYSDRISEAQLVFYQAFCSFPHDNLFWERYLAVLMPYMDAMSKKESTARYHPSLDAPLKTRNNDGSLTLLDILPSFG